ncbi:sodium- and chloride-dependent transporter XTRP3 isoform X4 [Macaca mulatta]
MVTTQATMRSARRRPPHSTSGTGKPSISRRPSRRTGVCSGSRRCASSWPGWWCTCASCVAPSPLARWCISRHHCPTACSSSTSSGASRSMEPPTASCTCSLPRYGLKREVPKGAPHSSCHLPGQVGRGKDGEWANAVPREADVSPRGCGGSVEYLQSLDHLLSQMEQLANPKAWVNAATQIFFSLGLGFGSLIAFASYNEPSNNCQKHAIIVSLINSFTSIFASIVTFSIYGFKATFNYENCLKKVSLLLTNTFDLEDGFLTASNLEQVKGYLASAYPSKYSEVFPHIKNCSLESELDTAVQGTGLAFIVYTEAIKNMEVSQLWSVLYFFMLLMLGIGSMLGNTAAILTPLTDSKIISSHLPKEAISGLVCLVNCAIGMVFTMEAGNYWFDIFNDYAATLSLLLIVLVETIAVCYVYGLRRFESDLKAMTGRAVSWYWKVMWAGVSPLLIVSLFVFYLSDYILTGTLKYQAWDASQGQLVTKDYPAYALAVIGLLVASSTMCIPLVALGTFVLHHLKRGDAAPVA